MHLFTVVIAEKEHIDSVQEYSLFLKPFIDLDKVAFCPWDTEGKTLAEAVPSLVESVSCEKRWRAIVLCDETTIESKNPFNVVEFTAPEKPASHDPEEMKVYLAALREAKFRAYDEAAQQPLSRLMTYLCESPIATGGINGAESDPEFAEYVAEAAYKQSLREEIRGDLTLSIELPAEILCIAKRTCKECEEDIHSIWTPHLEHQYSKFADWNMYFDKMRYLVFDILPRNHQNYTFDYIRFLYALLLLASNDTPDGCLRPNRVYLLNCENNETALRRLLISYDEKLDATHAQLENELQALRHKKKPRLTDAEAQSVFCANITVPVNLDPSFDKSGLLADHKQLGFAEDCPKSEYGVWDSDYLKSRKTLHRLLKMPRRSLKKAAGDMRQLDEVENDSIKQLNAFQMEDVEEFIGNAELNMVSIKTEDLGDTSRFYKRMEVEDKAIREKIETRMSKKTTVLLGITAILLYLIGFVPLIIANRADLDSRAVALVILACAAGLMLIVGVICLICLRSALVKLFKRFNSLMADICIEIEDNMQRFSRYLSAACNVMRGMSVVNYYNEHEDEDTLQMRIRKKHQMDIIRRREELREVFGAYMSDRSYADKRLTEPYDYDYSRTTDFSYPVPYTDGEKRMVDFMRPGCQICVPVDFVKRITVRLEELYD